MYLTRMKLDMSRRETILALATPERLHGAIERSFAGPRRRRLWRVDEWKGGVYLLLLSEEEPDLAAACAQFSAPNADWETKNYDPLLRRVEAGTLWRFRLCANPTYSVPGAHGVRGRVCAHTTIEYQRQWLMQQAEKHGFSVREGEFDVVNAQWRHFRKGAAGHKVSLLGVTYEGLLRVTDAEAFCTALCQGIGREKAYGMGLMTLMRPSEAGNG